MVDKISSIHNEYHELSDKYLQEYYLYKDKWIITFLNEILTEPYGDANPLLRNNQIYLNYRPLEITPYLIQGTISRYSSTIYYDENFKTDLQELPIIFSTLEPTPCKLRLPDRHSWIIFQILNPDIALISLAYLEKFELKITIDNQDEKILPKLLKAYTNNHPKEFNQLIDVIYKKYNTECSPFRQYIVQQIQQIRIKYCQPIIQSLAISYSTTLSYEDLIYIHYRSMDVSDHIRNQDIQVIQQFLPPEFQPIARGKLYRFIYNNILNQQLLLLNMGIVYLIEQRYNYSNDNELMYASYDKENAFTNDYKKAFTTTISFTSKPFPTKSHNAFLDEYRENFQQYKDNDDYNSISRIDHTNPKNIVTTFPIPTLILAFIVYYKIKPKFYIALNLHHNPEGNSMLVLMHQNYQ